ncbi:MAG TPA: hypothetical protein VN829_04445 [Dongiaceae bacterium]|nr:hypothetical protein [Dongiaceae bacterium]
MIDIAPPLTRAERWAIAIMCIAIWGAAFLLVAYAEHETRRATKNWPPHAHQERSPNHVSPRP